MFNESDILQDERYYIGVKLIKARPAIGLMAMR